MVSDLFDVAVIVFVGGHGGTVVVSDAGAFNIVVVVDLFVVAVIVFVVGGGGDCGSVGVVVIVIGDGGGSFRCGLCHRGLRFGRGRGFSRICLYVIRGRHGWNIDVDEIECFGRIFITKKYAF